MNYSVNFLNSVADCDVLLTWAQKEKSDLNYKKLSEERATARFAENAQELDLDLQSVIAEIQAIETVIGILPEGPTREDAVDKKTRLEFKKFTLETRRENYGTVALLEKENDLARTKRALTEVDDFIVVVTEKRATIQA